MKKTSGKITLTKQTLANLSEKSLKRIVGGVTVSACTFCTCHKGGSCRP
jgi:natural product precursor